MVKSDLVRRPAASARYRERTLQSPHEHTFQRACSLTSAGYRFCTVRRAHAVEHAGSHDRKFRGACDITGARAYAIESARSHFLNSLRSTVRTCLIPCGGTNVRTLSLVSQKGGAGKTTLSVHLAVAAHMAGLSVAVVDLDPQASAWKWSERR